MNIVVGKDFKKISLILIVLTIIINICIFNVMPTDMLIKIDTNEVMTKGVALSLCPIVGALVLWIANEKKEYSYYITNILVQVILFISNIILIFRNLGR